jgi:hypothetical protein
MRSKTSCSETEDLPKPVLSPPFLADECLQVGFVCLHGRILGDGHFVQGVRSTVKRKVEIHKQYQGVNRILGIVSYSS